MRLAFGDCVLDSESRELFRGKARVRVAPKTFRLLELLAGNRPRAFSKEELQEALWPGVFVAEGNLARLVAELRGTIGDDAAEPRFIRTIHGFGYAFSGEAAPEPGGERRPASDVVFKLLWADREIALQEGVNILGRDRDAAAWIDVHSVSRRHARIVVSGDRATVEDLGSKNGTFLEDEAVTSPRALADGDRVRIGTVEMKVRRYSGNVSTRSVRGL
jgi:DNA-binding winged helix-turn-helix (wHTH) protein